MKDKLDEYIREHILDKLKQRYPRYKIEIDRGDRIIIDDNIIKGILSTPSRKRYDIVRLHINAIISEIDADIKRGRFIGLTED